MAYKSISSMKQDGTIPYEFHPYIKDRCSVCGKIRVGNEKLTEVRCIDRNCLKYEINKAVSVVKFFKINGYGPETCKSLMYTYGITDHMDLIPIWFKENKPNVYLWEVALLAGIPGYADKSEDIFKGYPTFLEYFAKEDDIPLEILRYKDRLIRYEKMFKLKKPLSSIEITIMISDSIKGFASKDDFVEFCNKLFGSVAKTKWVKHQSAKAMFLISDTGIMHSKVRYALDKNIPVISSNTYKAYLLYRCNPSNAELVRILTEAGVLTPKNL